MAACPTCGQEVAEPPQAPEPTVGPFEALLTPQERERGVKRMHELAHDRQQAVKTALKGAKV